MSENIVVVENLYKSFSDDLGTFSVLNDISFTIKKGELVALVGISGAGKTTLLQILGGLDSFEKGTVTVTDLSLDKLNERQLATFRNKHIGFVFQFHHLLPDFNAVENVMLPGLIEGITKNECRKRAEKLLNVFDLKKRITHYPSELSGGERQRVALARAMFNHPTLILADEPTGNLDRGNGELLLKQIKNANSEFKQTFLIATHNHQLTSGMNRTLYLEDGSIKETFGKHSSLTS